MKERSTLSLLFTVVASVHAFLTVAHHRRNARSISANARTFLAEQNRDSGDERWQPLDAGGRGTNSLGVGSNLGEDSNGAVVGTLGVSGTQYLVGDEVTLVENESSWHAGDGGDGDADEGDDPSSGDLLGLTKKIDEIRRARGLVAEYDSPVEENGDAQSRTGAPQDPSLGSIRPNDANANGGLRARLTSATASLMAKRKDEENSLRETFSSEASFSSAFSPHRGQGSPRHVDNGDSGDSDDDDDNDHDAYTPSLLRLTRKIDGHIRSLQSPDADGQRRRADAGRDVHVQHQTDPMQSLLGYNRVEGAWADRNATTAHVAIVFGKPLVRDQVSKEGGMPEEKGGGAEGRKGKGRVLKIVILIQIYAHSCIHLV